MPVVDRKRRQFLARQLLILEEAEKLYGESGYLGLSLDELAKRIDYSKATVYNHYGSKEELLCAVAVKLLEERAFLMSHALVFEGSSRDRMQVITMADELLHSLHPCAFELIQLASWPSFWDKANQIIQVEYRHALNGCHRPMREIIRQARLAGDLPADEMTLPTVRIVSGLSALTYGGFVRPGSPLLTEDDNEVLEPVDTHFSLHAAFLDGLNWRPLSSTFDYLPVCEKARNVLREAASLI